MRLLVTGASGHFGTMAAERLLARVDPGDLVLMSREPPKLARFAEAGVEIRHGDFDDPDSLAAAAQGIDRLLLISATRVGHRIPQHGAMIEAAKRAGIGHIVYTSFIGATAENSAMVTQDHYGTEQLLKECGVPWTAMRDGFYFAPVVDAMAPAAIATGVWVSHVDQGRTNFVAREDCVDCAVEVLTGEGHENRVYQILGDELWTFRQACDLIREVSGAAIDYRLVTAEELYAHFDAMGIPREAGSFDIDGYEWCSDDMVSYEVAMNAGHFAVAESDVEMLLGRKPRKLRDYVESRAAELRAMAAG